MTNASKNLRSLLKLAKRWHTHIVVRLAASAIRISLGWASTEADVDRLVGAWAALYARAGAKTPTAA